MTDRELMQQALDALEEAKENVMDWGAYASEYFKTKHGLAQDILAIENISEAIRERLAQCDAGEICLGCRVCPDAQPEQKPVACEPQYENEDGWCDWTCPTHKGYLMQCCDCGLIHNVEFKVLEVAEKKDDGTWDATETDEGAFRVALRMKRHSAQPQLPDWQIIPAGVDAKQLTEMKAKHIIARDGYVVGGYILESGKDICLVFHSAVRWMKFDELFQILHKTAPLQPEPRGKVKCEFCYTNGCESCDAAPPEPPVVNQQLTTEQEPVAWGFQNTGITGSNRWMYLKETIPADDQYRGVLWTPLYTAPPQREWQFRRGDRLLCIETEEYCVIHVAGTNRQWVKFPDSHVGVYTNEQVAEMFELLPREREWQGLTDEEIYLATNHIDRNERGWAANFARAIEAKLKAKNA